MRRGSKAGRASMKPRMVIGERYNWRGQPERLVYLGKNWSGNGYWHQFALVEKPDAVWCEVLDADLESFEASIQEITVKPKHKADRGLDRGSPLSPRQQKKARKADKRAAQAAQLHTSAWEGFKAQYPGLTDAELESRGFVKCPAQAAKGVTK